MNRFAKVILQVIQLFVMIAKTAEEQKQTQTAQTPQRQRNIKKHRRAR